MNAIYEQYLKDEDFRAGIVSAARRERAKATAHFLSGILNLFEKKEPQHASGSHLARQG
jgi:hypothetical protein